MGRSCIADASTLPIIPFQYPLATGLGYPRETLLKLGPETHYVRWIMIAKSGHGSPDLR
jgi:dihydrodipicolinate synthase/N-acetylneuraminate lyase